MGSYGDTVLFTMQSPVSFFRTPPGDEMSSHEQWLQFAIRFLGPVLLGLRLLAVRARVKR